MQRPRDHDLLTRTNQRRGTVSQKQKAFIAQLHTSTPGSPRGSNADSASAKLPISKHANANKYRSCADLVPIFYKERKQENNLTQ